MNERAYLNSAWLIALAGCLLFSLESPAQVNVRISVKAVLIPATGQRQPGLSDQGFSNTVVGMNTFFASFGRGYRFQWVGNALIDVGGLGQFNSGPSQYYDIDFGDDPNAAALKEQFEADAVAHPAIYGGDFTAVNNYLIHVNGGHASFPPGRIILIGGAGSLGYSNARTLVHKTGHHFNLMHTHQGESYLNLDLSKCTAQDCTCAFLIGGNADLIADTIPDHECWDSQDSIAVGNYGTYYTNLTTAHQAAVDRDWLNIMSYHGSSSGYASNFFTSDQLDRWTDSANYDRPNEVNGMTWFVDRDNICDAPAGNSACIGGFGGPYQTFAQGVTVANAGDIVLIRPGNYNEPMTINKAITLRATRGDAIVGKP